ncbi:MAG: hypothetical protein ABSH36_04500 [Solirubrobacteraceae bacterium]
MTALRRQAPVWAVVLGGWLTVTVACQAVTRVAFASSARRLLAVHFINHFKDPASVAFGIWLNNSKMTAGVAACIALVALTRWIAPAGRRGVERIPVWVMDVILGVWAVWTAVLAGVLLGAYGSLQLHAFLPDGPAEIVAWALLLALYINARRGRNGCRATVCGLAAVEGLLALAAVLETGRWL